MRGDCFIARTVTLGFLIVLGACLGVTVFVFAYCALSRNYRNSNLGMNYRYFSTLTIEAAVAGQDRVISACSLDSLKLRTHFSSEAAPGLV